MNKIGIVNDLIKYKYEEEWFEFKENWFEPIALGEYVSALSNSAALCNKKKAYFVWGINDKAHEIVGTDFDIHVTYKNEPYQSYLARSLNPSINFKFYEEIIDNKRVVILEIPAANSIPTSFNDKRYIRIDSSKANISKYPEREKELFKVLTVGYPTIINTSSKYQKLTFNKLFAYYGSKGIKLNEKTFEDNLLLRTEEGKYNIQAQLLSDNCQLPLRISIFEGKTKASNLFSVREFGFDCLLYSLDNVLRYGDVLNIIQADEEKRIVERNEVPLFDNKAFREAIINAILHNKWVTGNEPMISVYSNRIEIMSRGSLAPEQTLKGFFAGKSIPVNEKLSEVFLQLHISEKSGRGVPKIVDVYGETAYEIDNDTITVTIPFNWIKDIKKDNEIKMNNTRSVILREIRNNNNIRKYEIANILGIAESTVDYNLSQLKKDGIIERIGSNKNGRWKVNDK